MIAARDYVSRKDIETVGILATDLLSSDFPGASSLNFHDHFSAGDVCDCGGPDRCPD